MAEATATKSNEPTPTEAEAKVDENPGVVEDDDSLDFDFEAAQKATEAEEIKPTSEETTVESKAEEPKATTTESSEEVTPPVEPTKEQTQSPEQPLVTAEEWWAQEEARAKEQYAQLFPETETVDPDIRDYLVNAAVDLHKAVLSTVAERLTPAVQQTIAATEQAKAVEEQFYREWPQLNKPEYSETVQRIASAYRAANPAVDIQTAIREVGAAAMATLRVAEPEQPKAPPKTKPFTPQGVKASSSRQAPSNEFSAIAEEDLQDIG